jgi:hypothetical protein
MSNVSIMSSFQDSIKTWVDIDNQLRIVNDRAKTLRDAKKNQEEQILSYVETNNLSNAVVNISDGKLKFASSKQTGSLTFKHVEECLGKCIQSEESVKKIMKYIRATRPSKSVTDIKRSYTNTDK